MEADKGTSGSGGGEAPIDEKLWQLLKAEALDNLFKIPAALVQKILGELGWSMQQLLEGLVPLAASFSRCPISCFKVGAVGLAESGNIYLGTNVEFPGIPLHQSIHAEQFLVSRLHANQERRLVRFAVSATPCGHCRQFLKEMYKAEDLQIILSSKDSAVIMLEELLPFSFGPSDLGVDKPFLQHVTYPLSLVSDNNSGDQDKKEEDELVKAALTAASHSYSPYSQCPSGVALRTDDGRIFAGSYIENAAFNPSFGSLQAALTGLVVAGIPFSAVAECVLVEREDCLQLASGGLSQASVCRCLLDHLPQPSSPSTSTASGLPRLCVVHASLS
ncbi:cytidine deaminase [Balamuthia mandrillaris]